MSLVLVELRSPGKEDHPSNRVTFGERLYEKKVDRLPEPRADNNARACSDCFALTDKTRLGRKWRINLLASQRFISHVKESPSFGRKSWKSWLAHGS